MSAIESKLTLLEAHIRGLIEGDATRGGISRKLYKRVLHALVHAMFAESNQGKAVDDREGRVFLAPDQYTIVMPAEQANTLLNHSEALDKLARKLEILAAQANQKLAGSPMLRVVPDPNIQELHILAEYSHVGQGDSYTTEMDEMLIHTSLNLNGRLPNAFLIVNGLMTFPLQQPVINIGNDPSNQLVLDDRGVSSMHAQLRFVRDRFVIFDLDSRQGTCVNGVAVTSQSLNPGDVIQLAGVPLVYGLESATNVGYTQKLPSVPPLPEVL